MDTLRNFYKVGPGPSSSHTIGPSYASSMFNESYPDAHSFTVELWGSLAATGKGHLTDYIIIKTLAPKEVSIIWKPNFVDSFHPNGMLFKALDEKGNTLGEETYFSVGGGTVLKKGEKRYGASNFYPLNTMEEVKKWCKDNDKELWQYVEEYEGKDVWEFLKSILDTMLDVVQEGLKATGILPGGINYPRKAKSFFDKSADPSQGGVPDSLDVSRIYAYALAASEENAAGGMVVTAPTCGGSGVLPGVITFLVEKYKFSEEELLKGLAVAGLIGNIVKNNASISGAEAGCQAEVGVACSMAAALTTYLFKGSLSNIEHSAVIGLKHHLGLTCDPVGGVVQIPCIERNAVAASRALDAAKYAMLANNYHIGFDTIVKTMMETGRDLMEAYRETSTGGLATNYTC